MFVQDLICGFMKLGLKNRFVFKKRRCLEHPGSLYLLVEFARYENFLVEFARYENLLVEFARHENLLVDSIILASTIAACGPRQSRTASGEQECAPGEASVCVYYCRTYDKAVCGGGGGQ